MGVLGITPLLFAQFDRTTVPPVKNESLSDQRCFDFYPVVDPSQRELEKETLLTELGSMLIGTLADLGAWALKMLWHLRPR